MHKESALIARKEANLIMQKTTNSALELNTTMKAIMDRVYKIEKQLRIKADKNR